MKFDDRESRRVEAIYLTPDVVAQRACVLEALALARNERVVDLGCGPGLLALEMAHRVGMQQPAEALVGQRIDLLEYGFDQNDNSLAGDDSPVIRALREAVPTTGLQVCLKPQWGQHRWLCFSSIPLMREGEQTPYAVLSSFEDITELRNVQNQFSALANRDALTGLPNRFKMMDLGTSAVSAAQRQGRMLGLLFIDLDHFKDINDTYGHHDAAFLVLGGPVDPREP